MFGFWKRWRRPPLHRAVLHAGMHKTGSTSVQHFLAGAELANAAYFAQGDPNHSTTFVSLFFEHPENYWLFQQEGVDRAELMERRAAQTRDLEAQIAASDAPNFVMSAEVMSVAGQGDLAACRDFFARQFDQVVVYAYVRSPMSFAASMFQQSLKTGGIPSPDVLLPAYRQRFTPIDRVFGKAAVRLRLMDGAETIRNVTRDFLDWIGVEARGDVQVRRNVSMSAEAAGLMYLYRREHGRPLDGPEAQARHHELVDALRRVDGLPFSLALETFDGHLEALRTDVAWMEARLGEAIPLEVNASLERVVFAGLDDVARYGAQVFEERAGVAFEALPRDADGRVSEAVFVEALGL